MSHRLVETEQNWSSLMSEQAMESHFRRIIDSLHNYIYVGRQDDEGQWYSIYHSPMVEKITGYPRQKFAQDWTFWLTSVIHPDDRQAVRQQVAQSLPGQAQEIEYRLIRADGRVIWVRDNRWLTIEQTHQVVYGLVQDVTDRKEAEMLLREFTSVASHDLQEPLRKIQTFCQLLRRKYGANLDARGQHYLNRLEDAAQRGQNLVQNLLHYSRLSVSNQTFQAVDLNQLVQRVIADLDLLLQQTNGHIHITNLPTIQANPVQLEQLFQNLFSNALKFRRPGVPPVITVKHHLPTDHSNSTVVLTIRDNGIGFEEQYRQQIFQPFQRLHNQKKYAGSGLGLAICRKIVERHGGRITVQSQPGQGTTFFIELPFKLERTPE